MLESLTMSPPARSAIRITGTLAVSALIWWSLATPDQGILREVRALGPLGAGITVAIFLALVAAYARDLHLLMRAIPHGARTASPASVWWMFLIPYNFTEDFFIIATVTTSLERAESSDPALRGAFGRHGRWSGYGWCALQSARWRPMFWSRSLECLPCRSGCGTGALSARRARP